MTLLDTNVIVDALDRNQANHHWAKKQVENAVAGEGGVINAVILAELCVGARHPEDVEAEIKRWGIIVHDVPADAAAVCGKAYRRYIIARRDSGGSTPPKLPLPDFFIGAQAEIMDWKIATRDTQRFRNYFPTVELIAP